MSFVPTTKFTSSLMFSTPVSPLSRYKECFVAYLVTSGVIGLPSRMLPEPACKEKKKNGLAHGAHLMQILAAIKSKLAQRRDLVVQQRAGRARVDVRDKLLRRMRRAQRT